MGTLHYALDIDQLNLALCPLQKVTILLTELGIPHETKFLDFSKNENKAPEFTKYNPNGRMSHFW